MVIILTERLGTYGAEYSDHRKLLRRIRLSKQRYLLHVKFGINGQIFWLSTRSIPKADLSGCGKVYRKLELRTRPKGSNGFSRWAQVWKKLQIMENFTALVLQDDEQSATEGWKTSRQARQMQRGDKQSSSRVEKSNPGNTPNKAEISRNFEDLETLVLLSFCACFAGKQIIDGVQQFSVENLAALTRRDEPEPASDGGLVKFRLLLN